MSLKSVHRPQTFQIVAHTPQSDNLQSRQTRGHHSSPSAEESYTAICRGLRPDYHHMKHSIAAGRTGEMD